MYLLHRYLFDENKSVHQKPECICDEIEPYETEIDGKIVLVKNIYTQQYLTDICNWHIKCSLDNSPGTPERLGMTDEEYNVYEFNFIRNMYMDSFGKSGYSANSYSLLVDE